jgi:hypothetical protein
MADQKSSEKEAAQWFPKGYWKEPDIDPQRLGDPRPEAIYMCVGYALTRWEHVEEALNFLFVQIANNPQSSNTMERAFGAIEANSLRLNVLEAAAEVYFGTFWEMQPIQEQFEQVKKNVRVAAYIRNKIAHGKCHATTLNRSLDDGTKVQKFSGYYLIAPGYVTGRRWWIPPAERPLDDPLFWTRSNYRIHCV